MYGSSQVSAGVVQYGVVSVPEVTVPAGQTLPGSGWQVTENWYVIAVPWWRTRW